MGKDRRMSEILEMQRSREMMAFIDEIIEDMTVDITKDVTGNIAKHIITSILKNIKNNIIEDVTKTITSDHYILAKILSSMIIAEIGGKMSPVEEKRREELEKEKENMREKINNINNTPNILNTPLNTSFSSSPLLDYDPTLPYTSICAYIIAYDELMKRLGLFTKEYIYYKYHLSFLPHFIIVNVNEFMKYRGIEEQYGVFIGMMYYTEREVIVHLLPLLAAELKKVGIEMVVDEEINKDVKEINIGVDEMGISTIKISFLYNTLEFPASAPEYDYDDNYDTAAHFFSRIMQNVLIDYGEEISLVIRAFMNFM